MTTFNSTDTTESKDTDTRNAEATQTDERHSDSGWNQQTDGDSTYRVRDDESVMEAVVRAVGSETRTDPMSLQPLHSVIDTEALNELFRSRSGGITQTNGCIMFDYCGRQIRVQSDGEIQIQRPG